jgi:hypothetical protein
VIVLSTIHAEIDAVQLEARRQDSAALLSIGDSFFETKSCIKSLRLINSGGNSSLRGMAVPDFRRVHAARLTPPCKICWRDDSVNHVLSGWAASQPDRWFMQLRSVSATRRNSLLRCSSTAL